MNPSFYRRDQTNQEMDSSFLSSLFLLSVAFMQFVSAAGQISIPVKAEAGRKVTLPCEDPDKGEIVFVEWKRIGLGSKYVLLYRDDRIATDGQHPSYKDRVDLEVHQLKFGDASLILKNVTIADSGTYECQIIIENIGRKDISTVNLDVVFPPDPFPVWAIILVVVALLVLVLVVAAGVLFYSWLRWKPVQQKEVESGVESVLLPLKVPRFLWFCIFRWSVDKVEWMDRDNRTVHVNVNGSDQPEEQNQFYRTRTKMNKNLLKTGDLSLTLSWPTDEDENKFTCRVSSRKGDVLMEKEVQLKVKVQQVEVKPGEVSVKLPWTLKESLAGDIRVEWMDRYERTVHVYQNGSDQPVEQHQRYRTRTKMDENLLKNKNLSLTLNWPIDRDRGIYTCRVYSKDRDVLMKKQVCLWVKVPKVEVKSGVESVKLPWTITESLNGDVRVEWMDGDNRTVHVYQDGSDETGKQHQIYRTRTKMDENLLRTKDLSLTLRWPTDGDNKAYTCRVSSRKGDVLMMKQVLLYVKDHQVEVEVESGVESVLLPCRTTEALDRDVRVEWMDGYNRTVHVYQNSSDQPGDQDEFYRTRTKMDENQLKTGDLSLTLSWPTYEDMNVYTCRVYKTDGVVLRKKQVQLKVKVHEVEVESGVESVLLPWTIKEDLDGDIRVVWMDDRDRKVHVYQDGSDQPVEQDQIYRTRTKMDENLLETKDLSLTLRWPREDDRNIYTCRVYSSDRNVLMVKDIQLWVKDHQVEVEPGVESVKLPWTITEDLDRDVRVVWMDDRGRKVHVYQNGSDQPGEQNRIYRTRTKMDEKPLETKNLSLTLRRPTEGDEKLYFCRVYNRAEVVLMEKRVDLQVKAGTVQVQPEDIRMSLLENQLV